MTITDYLLRIAITTSLLATFIFTENVFGADPIFENAKVVEFDSVSYTYTPSPFKVKQAKKQGKTLEIKIEPSVEYRKY